jgi:hypothetical protein
VISPSGDLEGRMFFVVVELIIADPYDPLRPNNNGPTIPFSNGPVPLVSRVPRYEIHKGINTDRNNSTLVVEGIPAGTSPHPQF